MRPRSRRLESPRLPVVDRRAFVTGGVAFAATLALGCEQCSPKSGQTDPAKSSPASEGFPARSTSATQSGRPRNVLMIVVDDLRPELGCYGRKHIHSPNIDALAARGVRFNRAYCQQALCSPSRISLLTGARPDTTGIYDLQHRVHVERPNLHTLPRHFKEHGYATRGLGKVYHHPDDDPDGWSQRPWRPMSAGYAYKGPNDEYNERVRQNRGRPDEGPEGPSTESTTQSDEAYPDGQIAKRAVASLREMAAGPFFLSVGFLRPHLPFACPERYWKLYDRQRLPLAENPNNPIDVPPVALHKLEELRRHIDIPKDGPIDEAKARELIHGYCASVSFVDAQIGLVLAELDRLGLRDDTLICLWGDHGYHLGDEGLWCKHTNFEVATRAPLIFSAKDINPGVSDGLVEFVDVFPTLAELCGLPALAQWEGTSLVPLLSNPARAWKRAAFSQYPRGRVMGHSIRTDQWRYTEWRAEQQLQARELYDQQRDPYETRNVAASPELAQVVQDLEGQLRAGYRAALPPQAATL